MSPRHVPASVTELGRIGLFAGLPGETLGKLAERMEREEVSSGTVLIREGEPGDRFFVLLSGVAGVSQSALGERRILKAGEFFGEVALTMRVPRTATVTAMTPCVVASCDEATFDELVRPSSRTTEFLRKSETRSREISDALRSLKPAASRPGRSHSDCAMSSSSTASANRGHASFAHSSNSRVVSAAQTTRASGSTQRNVPEPPKCP